MLSGEIALKITIIITIDPSTFDAAQLSVHHKI